MPILRRSKRNGYYNSSAPKAMSSNNVGDGEKSDALVIKPSNIRIWIHEKDLKRLTKVVWEGHGMRLIRETSNNKKVKSFLDAVPYVMATIRDVNKAAVENDIELLKSATEDPVPPCMLACKDKNGLTPLHKAAGLGHLEILEYILQKWPEAATILDNTGKTPLHWAAAKNNFRAFNLLVQAGADEIAVDHQMRSPGHYRSKPSDLDRSFLREIPEAPRTPRKPPTFDWSMFFDEDSANNNEPSLVQSVLASKHRTVSVSNQELSTRPVDDNGEDDGETEKLVAESVQNILEMDGSEETRRVSARLRRSASESKEPDDDEGHDENGEAENDENAENGEAEEGENDEVVENGDAEGVVEENGEAEENGEVEETNEEQGDEETNEKEGEPEYETNEGNETQIKSSSQTDNTDADDEASEKPGEEGEEEEEEEAANEEEEDGEDEEKENGSEDAPAVDEPEADVLVINSDEATNDEKDNDSSSSSPTPAMEITGLVQGEPEDSGQLQSQGGTMQSDDDDDEDVQALIEAADMEKLASLVLNGRGRKLQGHFSDQSEIQLFLDNVPQYMDKINKVHMAARDGNLRDLQSSLDRRKFSTARDEASPYGATPLHVATLFGHAGIVRYLAGRFSESLESRDDKGRTPLHYAALIKDNGHFYNLLVNLGADPKAADDDGYTAEQYADQEQSELNVSHKQLLRDYGADESLADDMLIDQNPSNGQIEIPLFRTEEGIYLATSLGDPLIKGLTEVANCRPTDPITFLAHYLLSFANENKASTNKASAALTNSAIVAAEAEIEVEDQAAAASAISIALPVAESNKSSAKSSKSLASVKDMEFDEDNESQPTAPSDDRDEHGQSILHFACARSHGKNALIQLIEESDTSVTYRDELYRTARDVSLQANQPDNAKEIDRYVLGLAARGDLETIKKMILDGYDHILELTDVDGTTIEQVSRSRGQEDLVAYLQTIRDFEQARENLLAAIRVGDLERVKSLVEENDGDSLCRAKNYYGRCALHVAVLMENEEITNYLATNFRQVLRNGDNLERTPLHYAMGIGNVEAISRILIKNGAKRVVKDLKGRQPSYYFMNKADIMRLQEEEKE